MLFEVSHRIADLDQAQYERLYFDEPFNEALCEALGLTRRLIRLEKEGDRIVREVEVIPQREIPAAVRKLLGGNSIAYTETIEYTLGSGLGSWRSVSSVLTDKIDSEGALHIFPGPAGSTMRRVTGHVTVHIFGLGKVVEKYIVADVTSGYERAANFTAGYVKDGRF